MDDPFFGAPYIDEDLWDESVVRHRYVHGGFKGTDTRFAFYFLEAEHYKGRFLSYLQVGAAEGREAHVTADGTVQLTYQCASTVGGHDGRAFSAAQHMANILEIAKAYGAYFVECNYGHIGADHGPDDQTITAFRANAQAARYARLLAEEMYGSAPHHGYQYGASSGGLRSIFAMEHVYDVWDGAVPFVPGPFISDFVGSSMALPPAVLNAEGTLALLGPKSKASVLDAVEPGGGDPLEGLGSLEGDAVDALFKSGFPRRGLFQYARPSFMTLGVPRWVMMSLAADPGYVKDFWTVPGYAGADGELEHKLIDTEATLSEIHTTTELAASGITDHPFAGLPGGGASPLAEMCRGVVSADGWPANSMFADIFIRSGKAAGNELTSYGTFGDVLVVGASGGYYGSGAPFLADLIPGDKVAIDNRHFLAAALYFRYAGHRQLIAPGDVSPGRSSTAGQMMPGYLPTGVTGRFHGKMVMFHATLDVLAPPGGAVMYDEMVHRAYGDETDSKFRLWWVDHTCHTGLPLSPPGPPPAPETRTVLYGGVVQEALRSVIEWVEEGVDPAPSTAYRVEDGQVVLAPSAAERQGVQPVATATVNGAVRAEVRAGSPVSFEVRAEAPPRGGTIIGVAWDFDGSGKFAFEHDGIDGSSASVKLATTHTFDTPGTYFPAVRVVSERDGKLDARLFRIENLDRVRIVVT